MLGVPPRMPLGVRAPHNGVYFFRSRFCRRVFEYILMSGLLRREKNFGLIFQQNVGISFFNKPPRSINHKATKNKTNTGTTALERSVE